MPTSVIAVVVAAGVALGLAYTLSPMTIWFVAGGAALVWWAGRDLPPRERRWVGGLLVGAMAIRAAMVAALFLFGSPDTLYVPFNVFFGDEQYNIIRALRLRAFWLGSSIRQDAFMNIFELYGRSSYVQTIAFLQLLVGPAPYAVRLFSILVYACGGVVLHRMVRRAFGRVPAFVSLAFLLFLPSLLIWSSAALKESLNFFVVVSTLACAMLCFRSPWKWRLLAAIGVVAGIAMLATLRDGAVEIAALGLALGLAGAFATRRAWHFAVAVVLALAIAGPLLRSSRVQAAAMDAVRAAARKHQGHAYTRGHSYQLLDDVYYGRRGIGDMTMQEAVPFVGRGIVSVVVFPAPWQMRSRAELAYLPEQIIWYGVLFTAAIGFIAGLRRDSLVMCLFAGYAVVALLAVGVNSGNMGTLVRHRAFALPYLGALSALGATAIFGRIARTEVQGAEDATKSPV
jgi:4-amino-4-deoxy-L-arabinose transferase-like glycosyltransferase